MEPDFWAVLQRQYVSGPVPRVDAAGAVRRGHRAFTRRLIRKLTLAVAVAAALPGTALLIDTFVPALPGLAATQHTAPPTGTAGPTPGDIPSDTPGGTSTPTVPGPTLVALAAPASLTAAWQVDAKGLLGVLLTWEMSSSREVTGFAVWRDGEVVARPGRSARAHFDAVASRPGNHDYQVRATGVGGRLSAGATATAPGTPPPPDLVITVSVNNDGTGFVVVRNDGSGPAGRFSVVADPIGTETVTGLAAGQSVSLLNWRECFGPGEVVAVVDNLDQIAETDEGNNTGDAKVPDCPSRDPIVPDPSASTGASSDAGGSGA